MYSWDWYIIESYLVLFLSPNSPFFEVIVQIKTNHSFELNQIFFIHFENDSFSIFFEIRMEKKFLHTVPFYRKWVAFSTNFTFHLFQIILLQMLVFAHISFCWKPLFHAAQMHGVAFHAWTKVQKRVFFFLRTVTDSASATSCRRNPFVLFKRAVFKKLPLFLLLFLAEI